MELVDKLAILADSAKYDVACTSSGTNRSKRPDGIGNAVSMGICHSFSADGRCISLLKILMTNSCIYDCTYCVNRRSNDTPRTSLSPRELADLTIGFYRRNYIEGLFLSSGIIRSPDFTTEQMIKALELLRNEYRFGGYIHVKAIPGTDNQLISRLGMLADRISVNIELPSNESLTLLAPDKTRESILRPMGLIKERIEENCTDIVKYRHSDRFAPAGQSTQLIVGATPDTDHRILSLTEGLYRKYSLKRVFFSAYMPVVKHTLLPSTDIKPPLLREHRLYQADWLLRFYGFKADELLDEHNPNFNPLIDPKCNWAIHHMELFPLEINKAAYEELLRVPGIGVKSAQRIITARRTASLDFQSLKKLGVVLKRAQYFITCKGKAVEGLRMSESSILRGLLSDKSMRMLEKPYYEQLTLFDEPSAVRESVIQCLTGQI